MIENRPNINAIWADLAVDELVRLGVRCFALSSGARSALLATAIGKHPEIEAVMHFDERASAFYALGHARATGQPAVWVTTSGTAVANGLPAVVEASQDGVPMILLTADRPPELRDAGANQAIDQVSVFSPYTRWEVDLPCPNIAMKPGVLLTAIDYALERATRHVPGPVHVNAMFREPLTRASDGVDYSGYLQPVRGWIAGRQPYTFSGESRQRVTDKTLKLLCEKLEQARNGLLILGRLKSDAERRGAARLASLLGWPVIADIGSGSRLGPASGQRITYADQVLLAMERAPRPDLIVHVGGPLVSKRVQEFIELAGAGYVLIKSHSSRQDPGHVGGTVVVCDIAEWVSALEERAAVFQRPRDLGVWCKASDAVGQVVGRHVAPEGEVDEVYVAATLSRRIPEAHGLFLGNSMPIRDMDMYGASDGARVVVGANRGASGIDGTIASACGWAAGLERPVTAVLGDLAFLHDLTSLQYVRQSRQPIVVVVINNDGGGIFSFLPVAEEASVFERYFGTPHGLHFEQAARQFALPYERVETRAAFTEAVDDAWSRGCSTVIEVKSNRERNVQIHHALQEQIRAALGEGFNKEEEDQR